LKTGASLCGLYLPYFFTHRAILVCQCFFFVFVLRRSFKERYASFAKLNENGVGMHMTEQKFHFLARIAGNVCRAQQEDLNVLYPDTPHCEVVIVAFTDSGTVSASPIATPPLPSPLECSAPFTFRVKTANRVATYLFSLLFALYQVSQLANCRRVRTLSVEIDRADSVPSPRDFFRSHLCCSL
jgi:hypothetical protein